MPNRILLAFALSAAILAGCPMDNAQNHAELPPVKVVDWGNGELVFREGDHQVTVARDLPVAVVGLPSESYRAWLDGGFDTVSVRNPVSQALYRVFEDDFDLVFFVLDEDQSPPGVTNQLINVSSENSGMGMTVFDANVGEAPTGSAGRLKAFVLLSRRANFRNGPVIHEVAHMWGNFVLDEAEQNPEEFGSAHHRQHWGYTGSGGATGGALGGFATDTLTSLGDSCWQATDGIRERFDGGGNGVNRVPYSALEMYLAGYWPASQVGVIRVFHGITASQAEWEEGRFCAAGFSDTTIDALEARHGVRTPDHSEAQRHYRILVVLLADRSAPRPDVTEVAAGVEWFTATESDRSERRYNYWEATHGLGTMTAVQPWEALKPRDER